MGQFVCLINHNALYEKRKLFLTRLYITRSQFENIPNDWVFTTKFNDTSILITIISCDYLNLSFKLPIKLQYSHQMKLFCYNAKVKSGSDEMILVKLQKVRTTKLVFVTSLLSMQHYGVRVMSGWLGMRIMCLNGATQWTDVSVS